MGEEEEEDSPESTCSTPETNVKSLVDESAFLRTHFESLTAEKADLIFGPAPETDSPGLDPTRGFSPPCHRPSISTNYFNRRRSFTTG